jgi:hypothetical protein
MAPGNGLELGRYRPGDESSICALFERVFRKRKTVEHWRWQFLAAGNAPHVVVARDAEGRVVAHFGAIPRRARAGAHEWTFAQSVDSMVDPNLRRGLRRRTLFVEVVEKFVECFGHVESEALTYGIPNRAAFRIGHRFLGYTRLCDLSLFAKELGRGAADGCASAIEVDESASAPQDHDELWRVVAPSLGVAIVRDRDHARRRYESCPSAPYRFVTARRRGRLAVVAVFRAGYVEPGCGTLVDVLWDGEERETLAAAAHHVDAMARDAGLHHVVTMLTKGAPELSVLEQLGYRPIASGLFLVARSFHAPLRLDELSDRWWHTFGDFDLA